MLKRVEIPSYLKPKLSWLEKQQTSILSAAAIITAANVLSAITALFRQRILTDLFFDTQTGRQQLEAFLIAFQIPDMLFQLLVIGSVSAAFIPVYTHVKKKYGEKISFSLVNVLLTILLSVFVGISLVIALFSLPITQLRTGAGYTPEQVLLTADLTRWLLIAQLFFLVSSVHAALLQSYQRFIIPALSPILYNLGIIIGSLTLTHSFGIYGAVIGVCAGAFLHMIIQLPFSAKIGYRFKIDFNWRTPGFSKLILLMPPRVLTLATGELQSLLLTFFTTNLSSLSYLIIRYALIIITLPIRLFGVPIGQASLPFLSDQSDPNERHIFVELLTKSLNQVAFFAMPAAILLIILRVPIVRIVFGTPNFPWESTLQLAQLVGIIAISVTAQSMAQIVIRAFFALKDTATPLLISTVDLTIFAIGGAFISFFAPEKGLVGLAWVISVMAFLELALLLLFLHKKIGHILSYDFLLNQGKIISASFFMAIFLYLPFRIFDLYVFNTSRTLELIILTISTTTIGMLVYIYFAHLLAVPELVVVQKIFHAFNKKTGSALPATTEVVSQPVESDSV